MTEDWTDLLALHAAVPAAEEVDLLEEHDRTQQLRAHEEATADESTPPDGLADGDLGETDVALRPNQIVGMLTHYLKAQPLDGE